MPGRRGSDGWYGRGAGRSGWRRAGVGSGRGRHHHLLGRGSSTSKSWVRARDDEISFVSMDESAATVDSSPLTLEAGSGAATSDASSVSSSSFSNVGGGGERVRGGGPILSGPTNKNFFTGGRGGGRGGRSFRGGRGRGGRGRMSYHSSQTWKRDATATTSSSSPSSSAAAASGNEDDEVGVDTNRDILVGDGAEPTTIHSSLAVNANKKVTTKMQEKQPMPELMKKVGTNKLVLSKKNPTHHCSQSGEGNQTNQQDVSGDHVSGEMPLPTSMATATTTATAPMQERVAANFNSSATREGRQMIAKGSNKPVLTSSDFSLPNPEKTEMIAKGKNKLVSAKNLSAQAEDGTRTQNHQNANATTNMIAKGRNKLVLAKTAGQMDSSNSSETEPSAIGTSRQQKEVTTTTTTTATLIAAGSNKLVSAKRAVNDKQVKPKNITYGSNNGWRNPNSSSNWDEPRKRSRSPPNAAPTIKRIKLGVIKTTAERSKDSVGLPQEGETITANFADDGSTKGKEQRATETEALTDFAYRETSSTRQPWGGGGHFSSARGGRGGGRGAAGGASYNMGLVRVNPEESKAPICPTFLRGIRCEDVRCTKRHDVPRESAMPVCSFFQRHGQCLKGSDCPFRHVKVNPLAMLCPSFNLLGYCDDDQCVMKHVAVNNKSNKKLKGR